MVPWAKPVIACTPGVHCDADPAVAAARAGAVGLVDLGFDASRSHRHAAVDRLRRHADAGDRGPWGVRWDTWARADRGPQALADLGGPWPVLLVGGVGGMDAHAFEPWLAQRGSLAERVLIECHSVEQALAAEAAGFDGLVIKANEAGGRASADSAYLLLQALSGKLHVPWWIQGAFGSQAAAAATLAGASGVVLCEELFLARPSPFDAAMRQTLAKFDGSETLDLGPDDAKVRLCLRFDRANVAAMENQQARADDWPAGLCEAWAASTDRDWTDRPVPMGQGIALAEGLARDGATVAGVVERFEQAMVAALAPTDTPAPLGPDAPLAAAHGTRWPIVQGPMTRVSDVAPFCKAIADAGALPMLALALMRGEEATSLLEQTADLIGDRPWGVGILGFVPAEIRNEQLQAIARHRPPWAIIAGGRPSQARQLDQAGTRTYLHVPSPGLLRSFVAEGSRRFVFEGRECGGHVGPRSSLLLWQSAIDVLLEVPIADPHDVHVLFAGGIHDALSAAMVQVLAQPLVERGMKVGVLMGTAYLFTDEAVATGAISQVYQEVSLDCRRTALLSSGVGHATRCARNPFVDEFEATRHRLVESGASADAMRLELEMLNVGRLRVASKGLRRRSQPTASDPPPPDASRGRDDAQHHEPEAADGPHASGQIDEAARLAQRGRELLKGELEPVAPEQMRREGMFMIGGVAAFHDRTFTMAGLHEQVTTGACELIDRRRAEQNTAPRPQIVERDPAEPIAIVGMDCVFPGSPDLKSYWQNIARGFSAIREVPADRWNADELYTDDRLSPDRTYSKWGSFLEPQRFDPLRYRIPPKVTGQIESAQLLALEVARRALADAGYERRPFRREAASVFFGTSGIHEVGMSYAIQTVLQEHGGGVDQLPPAVRDRLQPLLRPWSEDSFPGFLPNVIAGRVANRLNLQGSNYAIDAACSSSLAAVYAAVSELRDRRCDMALVGGVDLTNNAFTFMCFAKTQALTPGGVSRPFDDAADGILLGEGVGVVVLKRLADAQRDGDRVYAVISGVGSSSDGHHRSMTAPFADGQALALRRAYEDGHIDPATIELIEGHGTGTTVGDRTEIASLQAVLGEAGDGEPDCGLGSVKSMIGHTKAAAGIASLIKTALAIDQRVLPPTVNVDTPNAAITADGSRLYLNSEARPWLHEKTDAPRRAGVSAFGFGGTNFHMVLEESPDRVLPGQACDLGSRPAELCVWRAATRRTLAERLATLKQQLADRAEMPIDQFARSLAVEAGAAARAAAGQARGDADVRLAILAESVDDLLPKLDRAIEALGDDAATPLAHHSGVYLSDESPVEPGAVAFLFPGQGAQHVAMLGDLLQAGPFGTELFEQADRWLADLLPRPLHRVIYPLPAFDNAAKRAAREALNDTRMAQPAIGVTSLFAIDVLERFGLRPACVAGHSYGEYVALCAAGVYNRRDLLRISAKRGQAVHRVGIDNPGAMAAVSAEADRVKSAIDATGLALYIANINAPKQTVIAGPAEAIDHAVRQLSDQGMTARRIAVTAAFHTPMVEEASQRLNIDLDTVTFHEPSLPVYSNVSAAPYPHDEPSIRRQMSDHLGRPVRFVEQIQAMHAAGARVFIEAGPGRILTGLVGRILADRPHVAMALDHSGQPSWLSLGHLVARSFAIGLPVRVETWFEHRPLEACPVDAVIARWDEQARVKPTDYIVTAHGARPALSSPETTAAAPHPPQDDSITQAQPAPQPPPPAAAQSQSAPSTAGSAQAAPADPEVDPMPQSTQPTASDVASGAAGQSPQTMAEFQSTMRQWLELQQQQQRLQERFLALQERVMLGGAAPGFAAPEAPGANATAGSAAPPAGAGWPIDPTALPVAPVPIIPGLSPEQVTGEDLASHAPATAAPEASVSTAADGGGNGRVEAAAPPGPTPRPAAGDDAAHQVAAADSTVKTNAAQSDAPPTPEVFKADLLAEVSERTGYPTEMLDLQLPLESGLGIDSIKVIEIFSSLKKYHPLLLNEHQDDEEALAEFTQLKTLGMVVDRYTQRRQEILSGQADAADGGEGSDSGRGERTAAAKATADAAAPSPTTPDAQPEVKVEVLAPADARGAPGPPSDPNSAIARAESPRGDRAMAPQASAKVERLVLRAVPAPLPDDGGELAAVGTFANDHGILLVGDVPELSTAVLTALRSAGYQPCLLIGGQQAKRKGEGRYQADLSEPASVRQAIDLIHADQTGPIGAVLNLLALQDRFGDTPADAPEAPARLATAMLHVTQAVAADLKQASGAGAGVVVNLTARDGRFGLGGDDRAGNDQVPADRFDMAAATQAVSVGFAKALAREWPHVRVRNVDLDPAAEPEILLAAIGRELGANDGLEEVGLSAGGRWRLELQPTSDDAAQAVGDDDAGAPEGNLAIGLDADSVVLATGGACGITAGLLRALAEKARPTCVIIGRSKLTEAGDEPPAARQATDASAIRAALLETARAEGAAVTPAQIEQQVQRIIKDRAIRSNLQALREAGARVDYRSLDLGDADALAALIDALYAQYGRIDAVLHGAGLIRDAMLGDKTAASFADVFGAKVNPAYVLARKLRPDRLQWMALFSSVSGRFGNAGQTDYSAANACLDALAAQLDRRWPGRVMALGWGPWDSGMMSQTLKSAYRQRGIELIGEAAGRDAFLKELARNGDAAAQVMLTCSARRLVELSAPEGSQSAHAPANAGSGDASASAAVSGTMAGIPAARSAAR